MITASGPWMNQKRKNMQVFLGKLLLQIWQTFVCIGAKQKIFMSKDTVEFYEPMDDTWLDMTLMRVTNDHQEARPFSPHFT